MKAKSVILVHGAWADGSSWSKVIPQLTAQGLAVTAIQMPLTSFDKDVATLRRALALAEGPVVLVGHSYGGAVITEGGRDSKVSALVYVAAFAPDAEEFCRHARTNRRSTANERRGAARCGRLSQTHRDRRPRALRPGSFRHREDGSIRCPGPHCRCLTSGDDLRTRMEVTTRLVSPRFRGPCYRAEFAADYVRPDEGDGDGSHLEPRGNAIPPGNRHAPHH